MNKIKSRINSKDCKLDFEAHNYILELEEKVKGLENGISKAINGLEYAAFNLTKLKTIDNLTKGQPKNYRRVISTCSEDALLIEIRDLKELIQQKEGD